IFKNPYEQTLEAVYMFQLPTDAAVDDFEIKIANTIVKGELKKRAEAEQKYEEAKSEGKTAALLNQERPNIFTISVANVLPKEKIEVRLHYVGMLAYKDQGYELAFPLTIG